MTPFNRRTTRARHGAALRGWTAALLCAVVALAAACSTDRLLSVQTPSRLADGTFLVPQNATLIVASAVADFECALGAYDVASGLAAGELVDASQTAARWSYDRRDVLAGDARYSTSTCEALGVYTPISTARFTADQALTYLDGWTDAQVPARTQLRARAALYGGFSYVLLAEGFCSAAVNLGPELTTAQLLDSAEARFTTAVAAAQTSGDPVTLSAAYVGRARARLDKGNKAGAADDASKVPAGFVLSASADNNSARRNNRVYTENNVGNNGVTVAPAYRALTVQGAPDPRVRIVNANQLAGDQVNRIFRQQKYTTNTAPLPIASYVEARLILAEAQGGAAGVATLNALRARAGIGLPPLTATEAADFQNTVFSERSRELFLQGNRWFDERRGTLAAVPSAGTAYPKGGVYGDQRCWPLPDVERAANPNFRS